MMAEQLGKLSDKQFRELIHAKCGAKRNEVRIGPGFGVDVALVDLPGNMTMAMTSDPLSLIPTLGLEESAWLSVHLMANDMATTGFAPQFGQFVLNLPASLSKSDFSIYWDFIHQFSQQIGVAITGGHTGFIEGQNSTIAGGGTFITIAPKEDMLVSSFAKAGDSVLVTKTCALSSSAILALSFPQTIQNKLGQESYQKACHSFYQTSSLDDALIAVRGNTATRTVTAMHDVTEGGVLGGIYEMAVASGAGVRIYNDKLPIGALQNDICKIFDLDSRYCIGAGSMIIACKKESALEVIQRLSKEGIACAEVGEMTEKDAGMILVENEKETKLTYSDQDPYWEAYFKAYKAGWK